MCVRRPSGISTDVPGGSATHQQVQELYQRYLAGAEQVSRWLRGVELGRSCDPDIQSRSACYMFQMFLERFLTFVPSVKALYVIRTTSQEGATINSQVWTYECALMIMLRKIQLWNDLHKLWLWLKWTLFLFNIYGIQHHQFQQWTVSYYFYIQHETVCYKVWKMTLSTEPQLQVNKTFIWFTDESRLSALRVRLGTLHNRRKLSYKLF